MATCVSVSPNVGTFYGLKNSGLGSPIGIIITKKGYTMTAADFALYAKHVEGVKARNEFPIKTKDFADNSTDPTAFDYPDETREITRQGKYRFMFMALVNPCLRKELIKFRGYDGEVFFMYDNNVILGTSDNSGTSVRGFSISMINVEKPKMPLADGSQAAYVPIVIDLADEKEYSQNSYQAEMAWNVRTLDGLTPVTIKQYGTASATSVVVDVYSDCDGGCELAVTGLVTADFAISGAGSITSVSESATVDGRYTLVTVGATDSTVISLADPTAISLNTFPVICTVPATIDVT